MLLLLVNTSMKKLFKVNDKEAIVAGKIGMYKFNLVRFYAVVLYDMAESMWTHNSHIYK